MNRERVYEVWKGRDHPWVAWVKPSLFDPVEGADPSAFDESSPAKSIRPSLDELDTSWLLPRAAVIIDLPGRKAVLLALALGERGLRPVLAINTTSLRVAESISMVSVLGVLAAGAECEGSFPSGPSVGPAFILDSRRNGRGRAPSPGAFDNRWVVFRTDLPSAEQLRRADIERVIVVQRGRSPATDLEDILLAYQAGGIELIRRETKTGTSHPWTIAKKGWLTHVTHFVQLRWAVPRRWDGSYGRWVPLPPKPSHG